MFDYLDNIVYHNFIRKDNDAVKFHIASCLIITQEWSLIIVLLLFLLIY